jgi:3-methyladenine DNA glycosylase AlkD
MLELLKKDLQKCKNYRQARLLQRYFKTGPGEDAQGDIFLGIKVPRLRALSKRYQNLEFDAVLKLLKSAFHEERLLALLILIRQYRRGLPEEKAKIYAAYLKNTRYINNWDLVDLSAKYIVGDFLKTRDKGILFELAGSKLLWERRIAVLATFNFNPDNDFSLNLEIARRLLGDEHDLIHKAVGWMLREVAKRDPAAAENFLKIHLRLMPRTMLRYAIERFPEAKRRAYLKPFPKNGKKGCASRATELK